MQIVSYEEWKETQPVFWSEDDVKECEHCDGEGSCGECHRDCIHCEGEGTVPLDYADAKREQLTRERYSEELVMLAQKYAQWTGQDPVTLMVDWDLQPYSRIFGGKSLSCMAG